MTELLSVLLLAAAIVAAAVLLSPNCGSGDGDGTGPGDSPPAVESVEAVETHNEPTRLLIKVDGSTISLDGDECTITEAVHEASAVAEGVTIEVRISDDAIDETVTQLRSSLNQQRVPYTFIMQ